MPKQPYGMTTADFCRAQEWRVGTRLVGDEGYGPTVIEISAIGVAEILAFTVSHNGEPESRGRHEQIWTLTQREWEQV